MIPLHLSISGFLSYRDPVELDFTSFDLACIAGANGAGKSSLLDAMTWALFGEARKRDDAVINAQSAAAEVRLVFSYEGNVYRVQRLKPRDRPTLLEFHIRQEGGDWKPLSERSLRESELRIRQTLRLDYDTFVNASFFLQGKADQFTQQRPGDRKRILGNILGLEVWEQYREQAANQRKAVEAEIDGLDGRLQEIVAELNEEAQRKQRAEALKSNLDQVGKERQAQEMMVNQVRQLAAILAEQQRLVDRMQRQVELDQQRLNEQRVRLDDRVQERSLYADLLARAGEIEAAYQAWQNLRAALEQMEESAGRFREYEKRREAPRSEIQAERARLEQEALALGGQQAQAQAAQAECETLLQQSEALSGDLAAAEARLAQRSQWEAALQSTRQRAADWRAENVRLKADMEELKGRITQLEDAAGAECPLCGQPLGAEERQNLVAALTVQGGEMGDRYRANQAALRQVDGEVEQLEAQILGLAQADAEARSLGQALAELLSRVRLLQDQAANWQAVGASRLAQIEAHLAQEDYAAEARSRLAQIDAELKEIGYDAAAHDAARQQEALGRASETDWRTLEKARAALAPLEREIAALQEQVAAQQAEVERQQVEYQQAAAEWEARRAQAPDLEQVERRLFDLQEQENRLRYEYGAAQQRLSVLDDLRVRRKALETQREELAQRVKQFKQLERAFGKDGVPALLIEQALPEIEGRANELLDRLSGGGMMVRFVTQAQYKDKKRDDLKETLDIQISDSAGTRDYELFSGGEAFRVNFAVRLALAEVLAQRAGARLQTLVIDEGFGSQDALGRQRLVEAINLVQADFAKILVITHIDELKDAFPTRIEVEKTDRGSVIRVV